MNHIRWRWLPYLFSALAIAILLHSDVLLRHFHNVPEKVGLIISGPRTDVGDNYYYLTLLRHVSERILLPPARPDDPDGGDHRSTNAVSDAYAAALYAGNALYRIAVALTATSRGAVLLSSILQTTVLAFCFLGLLTTLLYGNIRGGWFVLLVLAFVGLVFVDAFGNSVYFGEYYYWNDDLLTFRSNPTRHVNPTSFWAAGLGSAAFIVRWLREERLTDFLGALALASLTGLFSISVGATLGLALGLTIAFDVLVKRSISLRLIGIALALTIGLAWGYLQLRSYVATPLGQELRHGEFLGVVPKWQFLLLLGLVPFVLRTLGKERVFVAALVVSAMFIGMFCDSFHLGGRLWLRGAVIYVWAVTVFVAMRMVLGVLASLGNPIRGAILWKAAAVALMVVFVFQTQRPDVDSWKGFVERDKWELLDWIDKHLPGGSIVASADIEDAFLLPIYTQAKPLYSMYGLTNRMRDDELRRYFYTMRLFGRDQQLLTVVLNLKQEDIHRYHGHVMGSVPVPYRGDVADAVIFLELVLYHAHVRGLSNALTNTVQHQQLERLLRARSDEASFLSYSFEYAIIENGVTSRAGFPGWPTIYGNGRYSVLKNPSAESTMLDSR